MPFSKNKARLNTLKKGKKARIIEVGGDRKKRRRLLALGFVPGESVTMEQKFPVLLVRIGYSYIAIDEDTGKNILVSP